MSRHNARHDCDTPCDTAQVRYDTCCRARHGVRQGWVAIQFFYHDRKGLRHGKPRRCDTVRQRTRPRRDTTGHAFDTTGRGPQYGPVRATTRRSVCGLGAVCTQPWPWVCALCTRPSFDSGHYFESMFESLFMSTVHEVLIFF